MSKSGSSLVLQYLVGGVATYLPGESFGPRVLNDYELVWIIDGDVEYRHDGEVVEAPAGTIILGRRGVCEEYRWDRDRQTRHAFFHFGVVSAPGDWPAWESWPVARRMRSGDPVRPLFRQVLNRWCHRWGRRRRTPTPGICRVVAALLDCFLEVETERASPSARGLPEAVRRALDWTAIRLANESDAAIGLEDLASQANVSSSHLVRLFRRSLGVTPIRALQMMRLEQAMTLLERSNLNVSQIADRCGFSSQFHFSRAFKQAYGVSPSVMRGRFEQGDLRPPSPLPIDAPSLDAALRVTG